MENVIAFNSELSGLYENKPPISKAKMAAITRSAMRAIKFYKHVVQSVEKFILKCKSEYKVPGLYVIDSIVRQSRHQFGAEKDVFAPRFARNIKETFSNLFHCAPEDKSRIIRVLNLWQKNNVFAAEVIQPLFDLADPKHSIYQAQPSGAASGPSGSSAVVDIASASNGLNVTADMNISSGSAAIASGSSDDKLGTMPDLKNNLKQLLNDPNVLRQLQTLQNFQKFKQQEEKKHKLNEMRMQEEAFEKHLQHVLKGTGPIVGQDEADFNKEVQFISEEKNIEVINLDGNDSRSPTPNRDRYKRRRSRSRSRTRSRSKDRDRGGRDRDRDRRRRSRSRSRSSRSPRSNRRRGSSRDRDRSDRNRSDNRDKEKDREYERERRKKGLPEIRKDHLSVCSTTLWVGHLSKLVYQEELSDTFGAYGDIVSIDQIVPRGCAFIVMNRRQDAYKAMQGLKNHKLQGRAITISWAAGKGVKSKEWKDYWDIDLGVTYIPWTKLDESTDLDSLEEGGMFDEDSMPIWMKNKINHLKEKGGIGGGGGGVGVGAGPGGETLSSTNVLFGIDTTQPPPGPPPTGGPSQMMPMVAGQFSMAPPMAGPPRMLAMPLSGISMTPNLVPGMPPPHAMMMPTGMLPPNFPPIPGQGGPVDLGPGGPQFATQSGASTAVPPPNMMNTNIDDQMDIEMDEEEATMSIPQPAMPPILNFNQPPPMFGAPGMNPGIPPNTLSDGNEVFNRERNRGAGGATRWGARGNGGSGGGDEDNGIDGAQSRWRDNFNSVSGGNFNDVRNNGPHGAIPINILPLDLNNPPQRPDFLNDFDNRGGARGNGRMAPNHNADFFPNMQNRFNQPTSLLQMRIPPPNSFNPRMGGPSGQQPLFMRAQGTPGGGRQQGTGYFNSRNPFDRDNNRNNRGAGGGGGGRGGNARAGRSNSGNRLGNWSDEEDEGGNFKRRGGNRFRDRDGNDEQRHSRDRQGRRGANAGAAGQGSGPQNERGGRSDRENRENEEVGRNGDNNANTNSNVNNNNTNNNRRGSCDELPTAISTTEQQQQQITATNIADTEDDWDKELEDYDARMAAENAARENNAMNHEDTNINNNDNSDIKTFDVNQTINRVDDEVSNEQDLPVVDAYEREEMSVREVRQSPPAAGPIESIPESAPVQDCSPPESCSTQTIVKMTDEENISSNGVAEMVEPAAANDANEG